MSIELTFQEAILTTWNLFRRNIKFFAVLALIYTILLQSTIQGKLDAIGLLPGGFIITGVLNVALGGWPGLFRLVVSVIGIALTIIMQMGLISITLSLIDGNIPRYSQLYEKDSPLIKEYKHLASYIIATVIYFLLIVIGFICLIIPGIYFEIKYMFFTFIIIDKNMGPIEALKKSGEITKGIKLDLFEFMIAFFVCTLPLNVILFALIGFRATYPTLSNPIITLLSTFLTFPITIFMGILYRSALTAKSHLENKDQNNNQLIERTNKKLPISNTATEEVVTEESDADAYNIIDS